MAVRKVLAASTEVLTDLEAEYMSSVSFSRTLSMAWQGVLSRAAASWIGLSEAATAESTRARVLARMELAAESELMSSSR
jgi:hypothetical protein